MPAKAALQIEHQLPAWKLSLALLPPPHFPMLPLSVKSDCRELFQLKKMDVVEQQSTHWPFTLCSRTPWGLNPSSIIY